MTLLKGQNRQPKTQVEKAHPVSITAWPKIGPTMSFGFFLGIGAGVALTIVVPIIVAVLTCSIFSILALFGATLTNLIVP